MIFKFIDYLCIKFCNAKHKEVQNNKNSDKKNETSIILKIIYFSMPTIIGILWIIYTYTTWTITYYKNCLNTYLEYYEYINKVTLYSFIVYIILGLFFFFNTIYKNRDKLAKNLVSGNLYLQPIFYLCLISFSKLLINIILISNYWAFLWFVIFLLTAWILYCQFRFLELNTFDYLYMILITLYTLIVIFWHDLIPFFKALNEIHKCIGNEISKNEVLIN